MMLSKFRKTLRDESGQGMTEYIIIVALIAIAAIGVVSFFGQNIRHLFKTSADALAGQENVENGGQTMNRDVYGHRNLKSFGKTRGGK